MSIWLWILLFIGASLIAAVFACLLCKGGNQDRGRPKSVREEPRLPDMPDESQPDPIHCCDSVTAEWYVWDRTYKCWIYDDLLNRNLLRARLESSGAPTEQKDLKTPPAEE